MTYVADPGRYDGKMQYRRTGPLGPRPAGPLARLLAQLRRRPPVRDPAGDRPARLRPRHHPPRPRQQLRAALRRGRDQLRPADAGGLPPLPRRDGDLDQGGLGHVAGPLRPGRRLAQVRALLARPVAARGWASTTSTSSTRTGSTARPRWRRRWARSTPPCARARRSTSASPPTTPTTPAQAPAILDDLGTPLLIHQPSYSMLNRWIEDEGLLDAADELGDRRDRLHRRSPRAC